VFVTTNIYESKQEYGLKPVVFFDSAEVEYKNYNISTFTKNDFDVQTEMILAVANKMKKNESLTLELVSYQLSDEDKSLSEQRNDRIKSKLKEFGVDLSKVSDRVIAKDEEFKYTELKEELRKVELNLSDNSDLIKSVYEIESRIELEDKKFIPKAKVEADRDDYYQEANLYVDGGVIETKGKNFEFGVDGEIAEALKTNGTAKIEYISSAEIDGIYSADKSTFTLKPRVDKIVESLNTLDDGNKVEEQHILAYTDFDEYKLSSIDQKVLSKAKQAIQEGRTVTVFASTDNLGNEEYNRALAERRAKSAKDIIGNGIGVVNIVYPDSYLFSNSHPYGRMLNRAIVIRIEK
jgi:outer membrane protein OmpA-like peptidoglycan-associated protein